MPRTPADASKDTQMPPRMPARRAPGSDRPARHARRTTSVPWRLSRWGAVLVALLPLLLAGLAIGALGEGERERQTTDTLPDGYDSTEAAQLRDRLPDGDTTVAIVLFTADDGKLTKAQLGTVTDQVTQLLGPGSGSTSEAKQGGQQAGQPPVVPSEDGTAALAVVPVDAGSSTAVADNVEKLRSTLDDGVPDGVTARVTGPAGIEADLASVFDGANTRLLLVTGTVVAVLLIITYRSPVLWVVPLLVVGIADRFAAIAATQVMAAFDVAWDESTTGILSVLVFGAGTDYALLLISRYRDELRRTPDRRAAMAVAARRTAEPVLSSATTVVVGVLTLLLSLIPTTRGLGVATAVGITVAAFFVMVCLPSLLVVFGRWVFWPRVPHEGEATLDEARSLWRRIADRVAARPAVISVVVVGVLVAMAVGVFHIRTGLDEADQFLDKPEAVAASERIAESYPAGLANPTLVLTTSKDVDAIREAAAGVDGVAEVTPADSGNGVTQLNVVLEGGSGSDQAERSIAGLRTATSEFPDTHVGGPEAEVIDGRDAAARDRLLIMPLILGLVLVALVLLLRAALAPLVLVATVVGTFAAALGISWWLFTGPLGFDAIDETAPLFAFLFLVALGVDYNIFLVTRALEETREHGSREGMLRALAATGGVITSAGILLAAVFAALGVLPLVVLAQIGTIICIGVLLDTLVVRTLLVPSLALLLGDRFWWPRRLGPVASSD